MVLRHERIRIRKLPKTLNLLHLSDIHFSARSTHAEHLAVMKEMLSLARPCGNLNVVCITGDLVSRKFTQETLDDAVLFVRNVQAVLQPERIFYALGNHEMDLPAEVRRVYLERIRKAGAVVLDNSGELFAGCRFTGVTLPQTVYRHPQGHYWDLEPVTVPMLERCVQRCQTHPCILLAHTPLGLPAYAQWGADAVLSGHVHGGIVRLGGIGFLSPERRFLPKYTKGLYREGNCVMNVSAGIGKFRLNNPAELVLLTLEKR